MLASGVSLPPTLFYLRLSHGEYPPKYWMLLRLFWSVALTGSARRPYNTRRRRYLSLASMTLANPMPPRTQAPAVAIETHGCKLNQADSNLLALRFIESGYRLVGADESADVYVLNSCTVTHVADRKARHALRAARRRNPATTIVATGCYAQRSPGILEDLAG